VSLPRPPYKRTLPSEEVAAARKLLSEKWGITSGYWYPLSDTTHPLMAHFPLVAVALSKHEWLPPELAIHDEQALDLKIRSFLDRRGVKRVFELWEDGQSYFLDLALAEFRYGTGMEGYWFDEANDWVIYCSHEGSVTLAGEIAAIIAPSHSDQRP
jgi:hypothetical protein